MKIKRCMLKCQAVNGGNMENDMCELFTLLQSSSGAVMVRAASASLFQFTSMGLSVLNGDFQEF